MDERLDEIKKSVVPLLRSRGVRKAAIFGSFARGEAVTGIPEEYRSKAPDVPGGTSPGCGTF